MSYDFKREDAFSFASSMRYETREKGDELEFRHCPYCEGGSGNKRDEWTFSLNLEKGVYKCLRASCDRQGHFVELCRDMGYRLDFEPPKIYRQLPQKKPESKPEAIKYLESRGISEKIARRYHITVQDKRPNILVFPFYDEDGHLVFIKYRKTDFKKGLDKAKEWCEKDTMPILFGMDQAKDFDKPLIITEGQLDSLSVAEAGFPNAVSVPTGATGFTWYTYNRQWVEQFSEIIVFGDCEHGHITLIDGLAARLSKDIVVKCVRYEDYLGEKDANDILRRYSAKAIRFAIEHAEVPKLNNVKRLADVQNVDMEKMEKIRTGIDELDRCIRGMAMGQLVILTGKRGDGKSTFMSQIVAEALNENRSVFVYSGELADFHFKNWLNLQIAGDEYLLVYKDSFKEPVYYVPSELEETINLWYRDRAFIYDNNYIVDGDEFESLPETVEKVIQQFNVQLICIDNLMTAMEKVTENSNLFLAQSNFVGKLKAIAMKYSVVIVLVAHPKKANANEFQDDNDLVAGSSDITNKADIVIKYSRNKDENIACDGLINVTKNRIMGTLRTTKENAIKVNYSRKSRRVTGTTNYEMRTPKHYGWEKLISKDKLEEYRQKAEEIQKQAEKEEQEEKKREEENQEADNSKNRKRRKSKPVTNPNEYNGDMVSLDGVDSDLELPF